jgi:transcription antitermination factor NusG
VLLPAGNDENYEVWVSELGENEIGTTNRIDKQPASGVLFVSGNNRTWNAIQTEDIKYSIYRAEFNDALTGQVVITNTPMDYITVPTVSGISIGDTVLFKTGATTNATGVVKYLDTTNKELKVEISSGTAGSGNDVVIGSTVITTVSSINNKVVNSLSPTLSFLDFNNTDTIWEYKIHSTAGVDPVSYTTLSTTGTTDLFDEKKVFSNSSVVDTFVLRANLNSEVDNISPIIDLNKIGCVVVANYVNNDATNETTNTGSAYSKYISRKVILDNGQEAEDLRIFLTADLPVGSSVKVYAKLLNDTDTATFTSRPWVLMTETAPINTLGFKEYYYTLPAGGTTTAPGGIDAGTGVYTYSTYYKGFKTFAVKIVLLSTSTAIVPIIRDMRAIALQV